jgi:hypothetical protein
VAPDVVVPIRRGHAARHALPDTVPALGKRVMGKKFAPETIRIGKLSDGDAAKLAHLKEIMRAQERMGLFSIVAMDDDVAIVTFDDHHFAEIMGAKPLEERHVH